MSAPAHPRCGVWMRPRRNEVQVVETGVDQHPYRIWSADLWECPACGEQIVTGFGFRPVAEKHQEGFGAVLALGADVTISGRYRELKETA